MATDDSPGRFSLFMRQNEDFPENFSVGLVYQPNDGRGEIMLIRCNGPHGTFNGKSGHANHPHWSHHIHMASEAALEAGLAAEKQAEITSEYASFEEAVEYFVSRVNISLEDRRKYFPKKLQRDLFP